MRILPLLVIITLFYSGIATAQKNQNKAHKIDVNKDIDLLKVYEQYVKDGHGNAMIYKKLANGYYFKNNYIAAKKYFELFFKTKSPDKTSQFRYQRTLNVLKINQNKVKIGAL